jgi:zinc protease
MKKAIVNGLFQRFTSRTHLALRTFVATALAMVLGLPLLAQAKLPIESFTTSTNTRVLFVPAPSIPMLDINIDFDAGGRFDSRAQAGLASLTASMLGKGFASGSQGQAAMNEAQIGEAFAMLGSQRTNSAGNDRASVSLRTLTSAAELNASLDLIAAMISRPSFPAPVFERERQRALQAVREASSKPETIAQQRFLPLLYGEHPYAWDTNEQTLQAITTAAMQQFYRAAYRPERARIVMIGAITRAQAESIAQRLMGALQSERLARGDDTIAPPAAPAVPLATNQPASIRVAHPASQSHILVGQQAIARSNPDFLKLLVGNYILGGGGFVSRLYGEVREKRGLVYSVYSYFAPQLQPGSFVVGLQTQKEQTELALQVVRETVRNYVEQGPTEAELQAAKNNLIGGFALRIDSNRKILDNLANIAFFDLPLDYLDTWQATIGRFTVRDIREAMARHIKPEQLHTVVVGLGP